MIVFRPHVLRQVGRFRLVPNIAWTKREGYITRDLSMPERDWSKYDKPAFRRMTSRRVRNVATLHVMILRQAG